MLIIKLFLSDPNIILGSSLGFTFEAFAIAVQVSNLIVGKLEAKVVIKGGSGHIVRRVLREHIHKVLLDGRRVGVVGVDHDTLLVLAVEWGRGVEIKAVLDHGSGFDQILNILLGAVFILTRSQNLEDSDVIIIEQIVIGKTHTLVLVHSVYSKVHSLDWVLEDVRVEVVSYIDWGQWSINSLEVGNLVQVDVMAECKVDWDLLVGVLEKSSNLDSILKFLENLLWRLVNDDNLLNNWSSDSVSNLTVSVS